MNLTAINSLPKEIFFEIFSSIKPNNLLTNRSVCKEWNENVAAFFCNRLNQIKYYTSEFEFINRSIQQLPSNEDLCSFNVIKVLKNYNQTLKDYRKIVNFPIIACVEEVEKLEQKIQDHALQQLWDALWFDSLPGIAVEPELGTIAQKREWLEDERNQPLLNSVTHLELRDRQIVRLPREIFKLPNLEELDLSENLIEVLPESIKMWTKLEYLDLFDNKLTYLPHNGIKHLVRLKKLNISSNLLTKLPRSIGYCSNLEKIDLRANFFKRLPSDIGKCTSLKSLKASENQIKKLPIEIKNLTSLIQFYVADNELSVLPEGLSSWKRIRKINISNNLLEITQDQARRLWPRASVINL